MKTRPIDTSCHELVGNGVIPSGLGPPFPVGGCRGWKKLGLELRAHWIDTANAEGPILGPESLVSPPKPKSCYDYVADNDFYFFPALVRAGSLVRDAIPWEHQLGYRS